MKKQRRWELQMDMHDRPNPPRWCTLEWDHKTRHSAENAKRAAKKRTKMLDFRVIEV